MELELTIFKSIFDNKTHKKMKLNSWEHFVKLLKGLSLKEGYKPKREERKIGSPLISPAIFKENTTRANANVVYWAGWAALDIDDWTPEGISKLNEELKKYNFIKYSTSSSTKEKPKFRLIVELNRYVKPEEIKHLWYALNKEFVELGDPQTKDLARMFYVPAKYPNAYNFFEIGEGGSINVDELLKKHPFDNIAVGNKNTIFSGLSKEMQEKILKYRLENLKSDKKRNYSWTSYKDCPFVDQEYIKEYISTNSNWYHKMYKIMVSIASKAIKRGYPITPNEIATLCRQIDKDTGNWYRNRPFELEASRAIEFSLRN